MSEEVWTGVDGYVASLLLPRDEALEAALADSRELPNIQVSRLQGKFLELLVHAIGARRVLEVGTLAGYSAIWMARALRQGGRLITLEVNETHAAVARRNVERAGLADVVDIRVGPALDSLAALQHESQEPFDLVFIDADKAPTAEYFDWAVQLSHQGSVIVVDNVVRQGKVMDESSDDEAVVGMRQFLDLLSRDKRVSATVLQTVGEKSYDGFALALVR